MDWTDGLDSDMADKVSIPNVLFGGLQGVVAVSPAGLLDRKYLAALLQTSGKHGSSLVETVVNSLGGF